MEDYIMRLGIEEIVVIAIAVLLVALLKEPPRR